jgi:hypothetical protein
MKRTADLGEEGRPLLMLNLVPHRAWGLLRSVASYHARITVIPRGDCINHVMTGLIWASARMKARTRYFHVDLDYNSLS